MYLCLKSSLQSHHCCVFKLNSGLGPVIFICPFMWRKPVVRLKPPSLNRRVGRQSATTGKTNKRKNSKTKHTPWRWKWENRNTNVFLGGIVGFTHWSHKIFHLFKHFSHFPLCASFLHPLQISLPHKSPSPEHWLSLQHQVSSRCPCCIRGFHLVSVLALQIANVKYQGRFK